MVWEQQGIQLLRVNVLLMYTDGVTDAQDRSHSLYDDHRLITTCRTNLGRTAGDKKEAIIKSITEFVGDAHQFDDITLVVAVRM